MPVRVPELTTCIDHPPPPWLRHGETRQPPQRDDELAISCDARTGPQHWAGGLENRGPNRRLPCRQHCSGVIERRI
jgi:hypothetical protein